MARKKQSNVSLEWPKPIFAEVVKTNKNFEKNFHNAMMFAHYELSSTELKKEVSKYLKLLDPKHPLLEKMKNIHENRFTTIGKYVYILNHNGDVPADIFVGILPTLEKTINEEAKECPKNKPKADEVSAQVTPTSVISIHDRIKDKAREVAGEVEGWIDDFCMDKKLSVKSVEDFVNLFKTYDLKSPHMRYMQNIFENRATEISEVLEDKNKYLVEAYSNFTKPELKKFDLFHKNLLKACEMMQETAKVDRAPRKKKPVSQEKLISKIKYKKEDNILGIVSINPINIIGAKELWVYNIRTRKLAQYKALDESGLSVKGAGVVNYSPDSVEKTLRKPIEALADFKKASKVKLRTFLKELSTLDTPCGGKLNENHLILRIDK
jgi:hypothetical protein